MIPVSLWSAVNITPFQERIILTLGIPRGLECQAPMWRLAAFGIENRPERPEPDSLLKLGRPVFTVALGTIHGTIRAIHRIGEGFETPHLSDTRTQ